MARTRSAWRLVKSRHLQQAWNGEGARLFGGRWNSEGVPVVYLASSRSLALLELLVHLHEAGPLSSYLQLSIELPEAEVETLDPLVLPDDWRASPPPAALKAIGDRWVRERRSLALAVPSAIVPQETIFLLNPALPRARTLPVSKPEPVLLDARLQP